MGGNSSMLACEGREEAARDDWRRWRLAILGWLVQPVEVDVDGHNSALAVGPLQVKPFCFGLGAVTGCHLPQDRNMLKADTRRDPKQYSRFALCGKAPRADGPNEQKVRHLQHALY